MVREVIEHVETGRGYGSGVPANNVARDPVVSRWILISFDQDRVRLPRVDEQVLDNKWLYIVPICFNYGQVVTLRIKRTSQHTLEAVSSKAQVFAKKTCSSSNLIVS